MRQPLCRESPASFHSPSSAMAACVTSLAHDRLVARRAEGAHGFPIVSDESIGTTKIVGSCREKHTSVSSSSTSHLILVTLRCLDLELQSDRNEWTYKQDSGPLLTSIGEPWLN